ncbi:MAG TPA: DUF4388 domain-containing protein [Candidatus Obscuribacterales bacterium]
MSADPGELTTSLLPVGMAEDNVVVLPFGPNFLDELSGLAQTKHVYDVVIVEAVQSGFLFQTEMLLEAGRHARKLLAVQGALVFVTADKAVALVRESLMGGLSLHVFDRHAELYDYSPSLAAHVHAAMGKDTGAMDQSTDLAEQVLMSAIPVLTPFGIKLKAGMESSRRRNLILSAVDNYTPLSAIAQRLASQHGLGLEEVKEELRSLEQVRAIYPLFAKVPFLVHCFRNQIPFKLRDYLVASRLVTQDQLDEMVFEQQNTRERERLSLGPMAVAKGYLSTRQLEIALQDQSFYGQGGEAEKVKLLSAGAGEQARVQSLVGHLGTTDPSGLLQSLANNRESGVLSVEYQDMQFRALYDQGKITHAKLGKIKGDAAIVEFASTWREGIFVFIQRQPPADLSESACKVGKPLDKMLLDAALAADNIEVVAKKLPKGLKTPLEKLEDTNNLWRSGRLVDPKEQTPLRDEDIAIMYRLWGALDGLTPITMTIKALADVTTLSAVTAVDRLLAYNLVCIPATDISGPLAKFQQIAKDVGDRIGQERNIALLRLSLQAAQGYSVRARMFTLGTAGEIGIDFAAARSAGASLSAILKDLEDWQVKYIEYVSQELDKNVLRDIVFKVHQK